MQIKSAEDFKSKFKRNQKTRELVAHSSKVNIFVELRFWFVAFTNTVKLPNLEHAIKIGTPGKPFIHK